VHLAQQHEGDLDGFVEGIYAEALVTECTTETDGPMPASAVATNPYRGATVLYAEQIPLAIGAFVFGKGDFVDSMIACVHLGRDTDSICATTGRLAGGMVGLKRMPADWVQTLQMVNSDKLDLLGRANQLADLAGDRIS
jgi:ADP-ribosylglycohydrolase